MNEPDKREKSGESPLERVTGEKDMTPEEERRASESGRRSRASERKGDVDPGAEGAEGTRPPRSS
ncbi:hypothetical protein [Streptomyces altiplanensis]